MHIVDKDTVIDSLFHRVMASYGKTSILPGDCKSLSRDIFESTGSLVSETTLKRVFGFAQKQCGFSLFTLDSLARYVGADGWQAYCAENQPVPSNLPEDLVCLRQRCTKQSRHALQAIRNASGLPYARTIHREALTSWLRSFRCSDKGLAPLIAPSGFGKSIGLMRAAEDLWIGSRPEYPGDACCFIQAHELHTMARQRISVSEWFAGFLEIGDRQVLSDTLRASGGKLVLIIDGFDDRTFNEAKLKLLFANLSEFILSEGFSQSVKIILALRPSLWSYLAGAFWEPGFSDRNVFLDHSFPEEDYLNHTLPFNREEIAQVLQRIENPVELSDENARFFAYPRHLGILHAISGEFSGGPYPESYVRSRICGVFLEQQAKDLCGMPPNGLLTLAQQKLDGCPYIPVNDAQFPSWIDRYLISSRPRKDGSVFPRNYIDFTQKTVGDYFTGWHLLKECDYEAGSRLVERIYEDCPDPVSVLICSLQHLTCSRDAQSLEEIFDVPVLSGRDKLSLFEYLVCRFGVEEPVLMAIAEKQTLPELFFETGFFSEHLNAGHDLVIRTLFANARTPEHKSRIACCLFVTAVLQLDKNAAETWLREYRKVGRTSAHQRLQEDLMQSLLDWIRYQKLPGDLEGMVSSLENMMGIVASESLVDAVQLMLLLLHLLLYVGDTQLLAWAGSAFYAYAGLVGETSEFLQKLCNYSLGAVDIKNVALFGPPPVAPSLVLGQLSLARTLIAGGNWREAIHYADKANDIAAQQKLRGYQVLAYGLLEESYKQLSRPVFRNLAQRAAMELLSATGT